MNAWDPSKVFWVTNKLVSLNIESITAELHLQRRYACLRIVFYAPWADSCAYQARLLTKKNKSANQLVEFKHDMKLLETVIKRIRNTGCLEEKEMRVLFFTAKMNYV